VDTKGLSPVAPAAVEKSEEMIAGPEVVQAEAVAAQMIVVLAKNASSVRSTVLFLERRGFAAKILPSLNDAVELFSKKEANKLLLSVNFAHPKVEMLPVLMNQSFQIETILFAEENDRRSQQRLSSAKTKHVLFGPVSGPVVMMKIRQIDRDLNGGDAEQAGSSGSRGPGEKRDESDIKVGGGRSSNSDDTVVLSNRSAADKKASLDQLLNTLDDDEGQPLSLDSDLQRSGETIIQKGQRSKLQSETQTGIDSGDGGAVSERGQELRRGLDRGLKAAPAGVGRRRLIAPTKIRKPMVLSELSNADADELLDTEIASLDKSGSNAGLSIEESAASVSPASGSLAAAPGMALLSSDDVVQMCLREALVLVAGAPTERTHQLSKYKFAALITLRSASLSCSFVASLNFSKLLPSEIFHTIEIAFFSLLRDHGIEFRNSETSAIILDDMAIVKRAFAISDFVVVTQTSNIEVGVAKVLAKNPVAEMTPYDENMLSVSLRDLPIDEPMAFSVFLHLKRNQKYIRYLKCGSMISEPQVGRLERRHPEVLVEQKESEAYRRHYAAHAIQAPKRRAS
jgi:hypothetical protein